MAGSPSARRLALAIGHAALATLLVACHQGSMRPTAARPAARPVAPAVAQLQHDIDRILGSPTLERGYWGVLVKSLASDETLYARNASKLMMPASNMKIVTLAAAADRLGWDYVYTTTLVASGTIGSGRLTGDLVVVGSGDPSLTDADAAHVFDDWADRLKAAGILRIEGRIVGDDNTFDDETLGMGWSWDDLQDGYATGAGALQFNENVARVAIAPGAAVGDAAIVSIAPDGSGLVVHNLATTSSAGEAAAIATHRLPGSSTLELRGSIPVGGAPRIETVSVDNPTLFFVNALRGGLVARGIEVQGPAVDIDDIKDPRDVPSRGAGTTIASYRSPPLSVLATRLMKVSQNLYAETLLKTLGAVDGAPTIEAGRQSVDAVLTSWGIARDSLIERDGSGLSRYDYVSPETLVAILTHVDRDDALREAFESTLPIAARDGTLAGRMKGTRAEGNARAKTGSMANVRALSGYVTTADGEPVVFSILANNFDAPDAIAKTIDAIVVRLADFNRPRPTTRQPPVRVPARSRRGRPWPS